jgi:predicted dehydrogenase
MPEARIALFGSQFMGRAHSHAWRAVGEFFDTPVQPVLDMVAARDGGRLDSLASRFGWERTTTRWLDAIEDPGIDLVDIGTPNHLHAEQAIAAIEAGKSVACEKPLAGSLDDARAMRDAARKARNSSTFVWYTYRRVPALALARQLVLEGRLGRIYHVRAAYLQSWGGPSTPMLWRFQGKTAGTGALGDLGAHIIDMARFVTGDEIAEVSGAVERRFIERRPLPTDATRSAKSSVDDAVTFVGRMKGGAMATFEATRLATGMKNSNRIEIHGESGAIAFDFERMNELRYFDATEQPRLQGWRTILATHESHPWAAAWWPDGHWLGYEHTFVNTAADILRALGGEEPEAPLCDFGDAFETQRVMEAALLSARNRCPVPVKEVT